QYVSESRSRRNGLAIVLALISDVLLPLRLLRPTAVYTLVAFMIARFSILTGAIGLSTGLSMLWALFLFLGIREWRNHRRLLDSIPIRIHVNGSRGKTGTARLIGAALRANGLRVVVKTTGKMPTTIDINGRERRLRQFEADGFPEGNIREQMS